MENFELQYQSIQNILNNYKLSEVRKDYKEISNNYRAEKGNSLAIVSTEKEVLSYISSRMGETSFVIDCVLNRLSKVVEFESKVNSVLDLGSGTGATFWAIDNYIKNVNITAVEREYEMIKYSKILSENLNIHINYIHNDCLSKTVKDLTNHDLVIESFMLNEMSENERFKVLDLMHEKTNEFLILIEPGTPKSYERMMVIRNYLINKGMNLILPCPHSNKCNLVNDYCNFSVRVPRTKTSRLIKGGTLGYEDEKYFYLIFSKNNNTEKQFSSTILRKPVYRKGCIDLKLCNSDSKIKSITITKSDKLNYKNAKDYKHGDNITLQ